MNLTMYILKKYILYVLTSFKVPNLVRYLNIIQPFFPKKKLY